MITHFDCSIASVDTTKFMNKQKDIFPFCYLNVKKKIIN